MAPTLIAAIVLAAGASSRMGTPKQTLPVRGKPMLEDVLEVLRRTKVDQVLVVLGANDAEVRSKVEFKDEVIVHNQDYAKGLSSSIRLGLSAMGPTTDAVFMVLADQPFLAPGTVDRMIETYLASGAPIVVPVYRGRRGNPVLFGRRLFPEIMKVQGDSGARSVVEGNEDLVLEVPVDDEGVVADVDTSSDYERAARR
jgi:molybdenum cofactor cytidylyltransferase